MAAHALVLPFRPFVTGDEMPSATGDDSTGTKAGRPRKHADAAARQRAYRERNAGVVTWRLGAETVDKIKAIAEAGDMPANELANQMLKFALSNRDWRATPMFGTPLPSAVRAAKKGRSE